MKIETPRGYQIEDLSLCRGLSGFDDGIIGRLDWSTKEPDEDGRLWFEGMANVGTVDRHGEVVLPRAFRRSVPAYLNHNPIVLWMHSRWMPIGTVTEAKVIAPSNGSKDLGQMSLEEEMEYVVRGIEAGHPAGGLAIKGFVMADTDERGAILQGFEGDMLRWIRSSVRQGVVRTNSIGFYPISSKMGKAVNPLQPDKGEQAIKFHTDIELLENSIVSLPSSRESTITAKGLAPVFGLAAETLCPDGAERGPEGIRCACEGKQAQEPEETPDGNQSPLSPEGGEYELVDLPDFGRSSEVVDLKPWESIF